ncbi:MAG: chemotaxis protein CheC [Candidatus Omnitrophota bacterium]|nr:chemotaxis protein CheC [Candidatus Omnitrophota bacterium]
MLQTKKEKIMMNEEKLNEITEAASQRCSAVLFKLTNKQIQVIFSPPIITDAKKATPLLNSEEIGEGVYLPIKGDVQGSGILLFPKEIACHLCDIIMKRKLHTTQELCSFDKEVLKEVSNIIIGNYLSVFSNSIKGEVTEGMPNFTSGMFGAILEEVVSNFAKDNSKVLAIKIEFMLETLKLKGTMLLLFESETVSANWLAS